MTPELVIRGGTVVDGTGGPPFDADVAIAGGRVVDIGPNLSGEQELDGRGCVVAPGFVDVHTHYDPQVTWDPWVTPSSRLGVTSVVAGNCGFSVAPCRPELRPLMMRTLEAVEDMSFDAMSEAIPWSFETYPEYLRALAARGLGLNFGGYVGHTAVRLWAMGEDAYEREATTAEVARMRTVVADAITGGALGFSTDRAGFLQGDSGRPVPSVVASAAETETLMMTVADVGRGIAHVAPGDTFEWVYDFAARFGHTLTWSAILAYPDIPSRTVTWRDKLARQSEAIAAGLDVHPQVTSRVLTFQFTLENPLVLYGYPAFATLDPNDVEKRKAAFRDPAWRRRAAEEISARGPGPWTTMIVGETEQPGLQGRTIADIAAERRSEPIDALVDVALAEELGTRFSVAAANQDPASVASLLTGPGCVLGLSDAGAHIGQLCDAVMPLHFLSEWVRDRGLMPLEAGIRKTSSELADVVGLRDRGYVRPGAHADVIVLEWDNVAPGPIRRVRDLPGGGERLVAHEPEGLRHVLVNGTPIRVDHEMRRPERLPGMLLEPKTY
jgi:N-acyl-D-aspartate/D-glutamate deacylase